MEVRCFRCGDPYSRHARGRECRAVDADGRCPCLGFLWVDPAGARSSYAAPPAAARH